MANELNSDIVVSEFEPQLRFRTDTPEKCVNFVKYMNSLNPFPSNKLNSTPTVLLQRWLKALNKGWYAIK